MIKQWSLQKAPALPEKRPAEQHSRDMNNVLRIYFNQVDAANAASLNAVIDLQAQIEFEEIMGWVL